MDETGGWTVRPAAAAEADEVARLRVAFVADVRDRAPGELDEGYVSATHAFVRDRAADGRLRSWFAEQAGEPIGVVSMLVTDAAPLPEDLRAREGYVINMYVAPEARGRGVARDLLAALLVDAQQSDLRRVYLHTTDAGRPLYEQTGFSSDVRWMARLVPHRS